MRLEKLQLPVESGWLGLPKLSLYHYAFGLKDLEQWMFPLEWAPLVNHEKICVSAYNIWVHNDNKTTTAGA